MKPRQSDPVINEAREVGHHISAYFNHEPSRLVAYYMEMQRQSRPDWVRTQRAPDVAQPAIRLTCISHQVASEGVEMAVFARRTRVRARRRTRQYVEHPGRVQRCEDSQIRVRSRDLGRNTG